jgi:hypothetical protein
VCGFSYALIGTTAAIGIVWRSFHQGVREATATLGVKRTIATGYALGLHHTSRTYRLVKEIGSWPI